METIDPAARHSEAATAAAARRYDVCANRGGPALAVPAYFPSGPSWTAMAAGYPAVGLAVMNPCNGPGERRSVAYAAAVRQCQAAGLSVLGYVSTGYGGRVIATVLAEVERYLAWYGVDGIFFDEVSSCCRDWPYYRTLDQAVGARTARPMVVLNPGTVPCECYLAIADIVVTFEGDYLEYVTRYAPPAWIAAYAPSRFWHLVNAAPTTAQLERCVRLSQQRGAGWVYVTPETLPNPWGSLPTGAYWQAALVAATAR